MSFTLNLSWWWSALLAAGCLIPFNVGMKHLEHYHGFPTVSFAIAMSIGILLGYPMTAQVRSMGMTVFTDFWHLFVLIVCLGFLLGSLANVLLAQAVSKASNPALPAGVVSVAVPIAYVLVWLGSHIQPSWFPETKFSVMNFGGLLFILVGMSMVLHQSSTQ